LSPHTTTFRPGGCSPAGPRPRARAAGRAARSRLDPRRDRTTATLCARSVRTRNNSFGPVRGNASRPYRTAPKRSGRTGTTATIRSDPAAATLPARTRAGPGGPNRNGVVCPYRTAPNHPVRPDRRHRYPHVPYGPEAARPNPTAAPSRARTVRRTTIRSGPTGGTAFRTYRTAPNHPVRTQQPQHCAHVPYGPEAARSDPAAAPARRRSSGDHRPALADRPRPSPPPPRPVRARPARGTRADGGPGHPARTRAGGEHRARARRRAPRRHPHPAPRTGGARRQALAPAARGALRARAAALLASRPAPAGAGPARPDAPVPTPPRRGRGRRAVPDRWCGARPRRPVRARRHPL